MNKAEEKHNPMVIKTFNPNWEPWLTLKEAYEETYAMHRGLIRFLQNGNMEV